MKLGIMYCTVTMLNDFQKGMSHVLSCVGGTFFVEVSLWKEIQSVRSFEYLHFFEIEGLGLPLRNTLRNGLRNRLRNLGNLRGFGSRDCSYSSLEGVRGHKNRFEGTKVCF